MMKKTEELFDKYNIILLAVVAVIFFYTRWQELGEICYYMHADELRDAYAAMSIAKYGPGSVQTAPSLYVFLCALVFKLKGGLFSLKLFRLLSVAGGLFGMIFTYLTGMIMTGRKRFAFLTSIVVTALPVFYISNRAGMGEYMFVYIIPSAVYFLLKSISDHKKVSFVLSGILFGLILFTSPVASVFIPVFAVATALFLVISKKMSYKELFFFALPIVILYVPVAVVGPDPQVSFSNVANNFVNLKSIVWDDNHPFNISSAFGSIYVFSVPVLILGVIISFSKVLSSVKKREFDPEVILWIYTVVSFVCILISDRADMVRANHVFFAAVLFIAEGLTYLSDNIKGALIIEVAVYLICLRMLSSYYLENYNSEVNNSPDHEIGTVVDKSVGEAVKSCATVLPDKDICVITENFEGRNLLIATYYGTDPVYYAEVKDADEYSYDRIRVCHEEEFDMSGDSVYVINQFEHQDIVDTFSSLGWKCIYLKEYTICYI